MPTNWSRHTKLNFPDAEVLLCTRTGPKTAVMTSLYSSKEKADQAMAARKPLLEEVKAKIKSINTQKVRLTGFADLFSKYLSIPGKLFQGSRSRMR